MNVYISIYLYIYIYQIKGVTTGGPVSTQKHEMETLPEAHRHSTEQRQPPENLHNANTENDRREELGPSPRPQNDPFFDSSPSLL